ncbi:MAG: hypothetical protein JJ714_03195 [Acidithiobacillus sp.]|nr:hypothetical protein [Acidithiobacillus sp.]
MSQLSLSLRLEFRSRLFRALRGIRVARANGDVYGDLRFYLQDAAYFLDQLGGLASPW